ncbi:Prohibitin-2, partial [Globisporangium splendens]
MDKGKQAMENMKNIKMPQGAGRPALALVQLAAFTGAAAYGVYHSIYNVPAGHRAVVYSRIDGVGPAVMEQGTHFVVPWLQRPIIFDVRTRPRTYASLTGTKDLQMINISIRVLSKPDRGRLQWIYTHLGLDYDEKVLPSIVNEVAKQVVAQFTAAELIYQRDHVSRLIAQRLEQRAGRFAILLEDVSIIHLTFGQEYTAAIEAKQVAQQDAERARFVVERALQEKKSTIIRAQGVSKSAELVGEAIKNNPAFVQLRRIDSAKEIATVISRSANKVYLNSDSLLLNLIHDSTGKYVQSAKHMYFDPIGILLSVVYSCRVMCFLCVYSNNFSKKHKRQERRKRRRNAAAAAQSSISTSTMSTGRSWDSDDQWQELSASQSSTGFDSAGSGGLNYPVLPTIPSGAIDLGSIAPVFGVAGYDDDNADYLDYDKAGRPFMEQMSGSCGTAYFTGILGGGIYGAGQGFRRSPSPKFKIRMNSLMNGAAVRGSKAGNALGCLGKRVVVALCGCGVWRYDLMDVAVGSCAVTTAMIYKAFEYAADTVELENVLKFDQATPILASAATGIFYKSTAGPKAMVLAGALGAGLMTVVQFGVKPFYPRL